MNIEIKNSNDKKTIYKTMLCEMSKKKTEDKNPNVVGTKNGRMMLWSKCEMWNSEKSKFIKEQETNGL